MILPSTFLFAKLCFTFLKINFFIFSVWNTLGISKSQICRDIMEPMSQEFVTELNAEEVKLNEEINVLLNGIDFQQSLSQEKSPTCIPSSFPEENGFTSEQHDKIKRDEHICSSPLLFTQEKKEKTSVITVLQSFICSEEKKSPIFQEDPMDTLEELPVGDIGDTYLTDEQFNQKYPQHTIDVSFSVNNSSNS